MEKKRNIKFNMLLNACKGLLSVLFPFISFPYISHVLQVENIGKYNFANSIISYFILIAGLGISTYAIREGAKRLNDKEALNAFAGEIFSIHLVSTIVSYLLLGICMLVSPKLQGYTTLILILSLQICFQFIGREWICTIFEDYIFITIRYIIFHILSLLLLFCFVKNQEDYLKYAAITVISGSGASIFGYFRSKRYCKIKLSFSREGLRHVKSIFVFFATTVAVSVYVSSDTTILGFLCSDYEVGIYSVAVKVYTIIKSILVAAVSVAIPRMAALSARALKTDRESENTAKEIYGSIVTLVFPMLTGIIFLAEDIVIVIAGDTYREAGTSLRLLGVALVFCVTGYFWSQCSLYVYGKENIVLRGTIISAAMNIVLNFIFIPIWKQNAAALTTVISEAFTCLLFAVEGKKYLKVPGMQKLFYKTAAGCVGIVAVIYMAGKMQLGRMAYMAIAITASAAVYFLMEFLLKNEAVCSVAEMIQGKFKRK